MNGQQTYNAMPQNRGYNALADDRNMQLMRIRDQIERERRYGSMSQGTRPMTLAENAAYAGKELTGINAMNRGYQTVRDFRGEHGIMNPATMGAYAKANVGLAGNALEATMAGMDIGALAGPSGRMASNAIESAIKSNPGLFPDTQAGMVAWHGSPHKFPAVKDNPLGEFDLGKMGSGEGAQAYGWGTYLAEGKGTAKYYRDALGTPTIKGKPATTTEENAWSVFLDEGEDIAQALKSSKDELAKVVESGAPSWRVDTLKDRTNVLEEWADKGVPDLKSQGHLYEVDLPDTEIDKMLDWDKPLSEQSESVQSGLEKVVRAAGGDWEKVKATSWKGSDFYKQWLGEYSDQEMAETLLEAGIPGNKFFDQVSRGNTKLQLTYKGKPYGEPFDIKGTNYDEVVQEYKAKGFGVETDEGTRNFVVFDPKKAKITGRN